jgi:uncharacterized protein YciI
MPEWLCIIRPPRATFAADMRDDERRVMQEHFAYLQGLLEAGSLLLAGPSPGEPAFGVLVLVAESEDAAWELVRADPSVRSGLQTPELHPFRASLLAGRD